MLDSLLVSFLHVSCWIYVSLNHSFHQIFTSTVLWSSRRGRKLIVYCLKISKEKSLINSLRFRVTKMRVPFSSQKIWDCSPCQIFKNEFLTHLEKWHDFEFKSKSMKTEFILEFSVFLILLFHKWIVPFISFKSFNYLHAVSTMWKIEQGESMLSVLLYLLWFWNDFQETQKQWNVISRYTDLIWTLSINQRILWANPSWKLLEVIEMKRNVWLTWLSLLKNRNILYEIHSKKPFLWSQSGRPCSEKESTITLSWILNGILCIMKCVPFN